MTPAPLVSVLMSVYNGGERVLAAVQSVLSQTWREWELVILDDGSTDGTAARLEAVADPRVRVIRQESRRGLTAALTRLLGEARGEIVARQDADDLSEPERLTAQVAALEAAPRAILCASSFAIVDEAGTVLAERRLPASPERLLRQLRAGPNPLCHGTFCMRRGPLLEAGGYREAFPYAQDYDLALRLAERGEVMAVDPVLYRWRFSRSGVSISRMATQDHCARVARLCARARAQGRPEPLHRLAEVPAAGDAVHPEAAYEFRLGCYHLLAGRAGQARRCFASAIRIAPGWGRPWIYWSASWMPGPFLRAVRAAREAA